MRKAPREAVLMLVHAGARLAGSRFFKDGKASFCYASIFCAEYRW